MRLQPKNDCSDESRQQLLLCCYAMPSTVIRSNSQQAEIRESDDTIAKPLPSNARLRSGSLTALFQFLGVMSHATYVCMVLLTAVSFCSTISAFGTYGGRAYTDSKVIS
jgi:hypothetical protein